MGPGIGRSIGQGFRTAGRSWAGIGLSAGCYALLGLFVVVTMFLTNIPRELLAPPTLSGELKPAAPAQAPTAPSAPASAVGQVELFDQLNRPAEDTLTTPNETGVSGAPAADEQAARSNDEARNRLMGEWLARAWPALVLCVLAFIVVGLWLLGGQIGYLASRLATQQARLSEFWTSGIRAFGPLLGASALSLLAFGAVGLLFLLLAALLSPLPEGGMRVALALLLLVAVWAGVVWMLVRLPFWFIAIVVDRVGPITGLKASFRVTRGQWWRVFGLGVVLWLISVGISVVVVLINLFGGFLGGIAAALIALIVGLLSFVANLYLAFTRTASYLHFYGELRSPASS